MWLRELSTCMCLPDIDIQQSYMFSLFRFFCILLCYVIIAENMIFFFVFRTFPSFVFQVTFVTTGPY